VHTLAACLNRDVDLAGVVFSSVIIQIQFTIHAVAVGHFGFSATIREPSDAPMETFAGICHPTMLIPAKRRW